MNRRTRWLLRKLQHRAADALRRNPLRLFPGSEEFSGYNSKSLRADIFAGVNVALLAFPQGMAYAVIANLPIQYGILSGMVASIVAPLLSSSRHTILGPTNATAFMLFSSFAVFSASDRLFFLPLLPLLVGILLVLGAILRVADLLQYVSRSVLVGYITGAAILIIANQLHPILGIPSSAIQSEDGAAGAKTFFTLLQATFAAWEGFSWKPLSLAAVTLAIWLGIRRFAPRLPAFSATLLLASLVYALLHRGFGWELDTFQPFAFSDLKPRLPAISHNGIFSDLSRLVGIAFSIAFLAALENSIMSKTLANRSGDRPDANQDMLGAGAANIAAAFTGAMPASGSLTRSALNFSSGAATRLSSVVSGLLCGLGLLFLGPYMDAVPKATLALLVICIAASLINRHHLRISLYTTTGDAAVLLTTLLASLLLPLNLAIFLGVGTSIMLYLRAASRPHLAEYEFSEEGELREAGEKIARPSPEISIVHVEGDLFFGAAELFRTQIQKTALDPGLKVIILRLKNARHLDATSVVALEELVQFLNGHGRHVIISGASKEVYRVLKNSGALETVGRENVFLNNPRNPNLSTRSALLRARELLGGSGGEGIRIFYDPSQGK